MASEYFQFIVIGGGIAGVTCLETLATLNPGASHLLITASPMIKAVTNFRKLTKTLEEFDVEERPMFDLSTQCPNARVIHDKVTSLNAEERLLQTSKQKTFSYEKLCICSGGSPKVIDEDHPLVIGIRDTETVKVFQEKLKHARRVLLIGNGGIATELAYEIEGCEVIWAIKDASLNHTFIDEGASEFFAPILNKRKSQEHHPKKRTKYRIEDDVSTNSMTTLKSVKGARGSAVTAPGSALGPDWSDGLTMHGISQDSHRVHVERLVEISRLLSPAELSNLPIKPSNPPQWTSPIETWPVYAELTNGTIYGCDFIVSATGVVPNTDILLKGNKFDCDTTDGGLIVNEHLQTNLSHIYAAGDVCHVGWNTSPYWLQMRLWSQARQMGAYAAQCMTADTHDTLSDITLDFCFELFAHVTRFFNFKVVLLGKFNAQGLGSDYELLVRVTPDEEYVKVVMKDGRMHGALLIGETDMEETFENLILNQMDLTPFKEHLLDPNIDIDDFFD